MKPQVLVTGAAGFIGSHLVETLVHQGYPVRAFVHYNSQNSWGWLDRIHPEILKEIDIFTGDVRDPNGVRTAVRECAAILHLAALIGIPYSYHSPDTYIDTNVKGTLNILQAARDFNVSKVVVTSTSETYGTAQFVPITEEHPTNPQSPYAASKSGADFLSLSFQKSFDLPVSVLRPFNTYGPRQSARAIIPTIISQIANGKRTIELGSLTPTRDLTFVKDTASGFVHALESDNGIGRVINLGNNHEISIGDLVKLIAQVMNVEITVQQKTERMRPEKSEVERLFADATKAKELMGWVPQVTLEEGIKATAEWFTNRANLSFYKSNLYNI